MRTPASIAHHPIHPMLVTLPIGLWIFSFVCDLAFVLGVGASLWFTLGFYTMIGGTLAALVAADSRHDRHAFPERPSEETRAHAHGAERDDRAAVRDQHRHPHRRPAVAGLPLALSIVAIVLLATSGWIGGQMVYVHRVGGEGAVAARLP